MKLTRRSFLQGTAATSLLQSVGASIASGAIEIGTIKEGHLYRTPFYIVDSNGTLQHHGDKYYTKDDIPRVGTEYDFNHFDKGKLQPEFVYDKSTVAATLTVVVTLADDNLIVAKEFNSKPEEFHGYI